jgi:hypothetical protein
MDSARGHNFAFNEAISLMVHCDAPSDDIVGIFGGSTLEPAPET